MRFFSLGSRWTGFFLLALGLMLGQATKATAASQLTLRWGDNSTNENGFKVERKTGITGTYAQIAQVGADVTSFIDSTVTAGTTYYYRVRAFNSAGDSAYSNEAYGTPPVSTQRFTLTVSKTGTDGTVTSTPAGINCGATCTASYTSGTSVILSATADPGSRFSGWSGGGCSGTGTCTILTNANPVVTATFTTTTPPPASSLIAAYSFDEGSGTTLADASGNNHTGTISGATWTAGKYGAALAFTGDAKVTSDLSSHATVRSYALWTLRTGDGGSDWGRLFDKRTAGIGVEVLRNDAATNTYIYERRWSGAMGRWTIPRPSPFGWHHIVVVYDASNAANNPRIYVDGQVQTVTRTATPSGSLLTNTDPYVLGNRGAGDRGWEGKLDDLRIYDGALSPPEIQALLIPPIALPTLTVTTTGTGTGTVSSQPAGITCGTACVSTFPSGTVVTLTAIPAPAATFSQWSGESDCSDGTVTMNAAISCTATFTQVNPSGLAVAYSFNEGSGTTVGDASGQGLSGTLVNGVSWTEGRHGTAVSFDGIDDKVTLPSTVDIPELPFTLAAWIRPTSFADWRAIFSKRASYSASQMRFDVGLALASGSLYVTTSSSTVTSTYTPPLNTWTHIAVVAAASGTTLYVNGEPQETLGAMTLGSDATAPVAIGSTGEDDDPFSGQIDDLRLYTRALSPAEIQTDMRTAVTP